MKISRRNNPGTAAVLSFVFSGLGQLYNGQILKGLFIVFFSVVSILVFTAGAILTGFAFMGKYVFSGQLIIGLGILLAGLAAICILGIYAIFDAYQTAQKK